MGKLNRDPIPHKPNMSRLNRMSWREMFPRFPIVADLGEDLPDEKRFVIWCRRGNKKGGVQIRLDVCLHSIFRFNQDNRTCKQCFHLKKYQEFPLLFLQAEKISRLQESKYIEIEEGENKPLEEEVDNE